MYDRWTSDIPDVKRAASDLESLILAEVEAGIKSANIILAGFSQGGALALYIGLTCSVQIGRIH